MGLKCLPCNDLVMSFKLIQEKGSSELRHNIIGLVKILTSLSEQFEFYGGWVLKTDLQSYCALTHFRLTLFPEIRLEVEHYLKSRTAISRGYNEIVPRGMCTILLTNI